MAAPAEPSLAALPGGFQRLFLATRPAFLSVTLVGCLLGLAAARADGVALQPLLAALTLALALLVHAGVNVLNDWSDADGDALNRGRIFPYTGGSRFIQNGVLSRADTARLAWALLGAAALGGMALALATGPWLVAVGLAGFFVGVAYSAPPLRLAGRGLGESCVTAGFWLVVVGAALVQARAPSALAAAAGLPYALLVANLLYINQFPDREADAASGKRTLVARLGPERARWGYVLIVALAYAALGAALARGLLPRGALAGFLALPLSLGAARRLLRHAGHPAYLAPAIQMTIAAATVHGLALATGLALSPP